MQNLLHLGSWKNGSLTQTLRHAGAAPAPADWKTAMLAVTPMTLLSSVKVVAAAGIAPAFPPLQGGANLSQLNSLVVPPQGNAPRSAGYRPAALLLSYGGI